MPTSCTFSVSSPLLPPLSDRQGTASCLPPFARAVPRPAATDDTPPPTSTPFFSNEMILTHLLASRNTVHARVAEVVRAVAGNKTRPPAQNLESFVFGNGEGNLSSLLSPLSLQLCLALLLPNPSPCLYFLSPDSYLPAPSRPEGIDHTGVHIELEHGDKRDGVPGGVCMRRVRSHSREYQRSRKHLGLCPRSQHERPYVCSSWTRSRAHMDKAWAVLDRLEGVDNGVNAAYYQVAGDYYKEKAEYALYYRHSLIYRWIVLGADCFALRNAHAPRVCEGIGHCVGPCVHR
ncbi:hypothetical protein B0H14DRAFT_3465887 [Mycena olivaceomarginata]|nr:hypothetical protein B0H14DRAFT_3465887 [Mycena olivaceomarginata]